MLTYTIWYTGWRKKNACFSNNCNFVYFQYKKIMLTPKQPVINAVLITWLITQLRNITGWRKKNASHFGDVPWSPRSPDLSACDFFLWCYLKSKVYVRKPRTVDDLKFSIHEGIAIVPQKMLVNVMQNFEEMLRTCVRQEGRLLSDIIFRNWEINVSNQNCIFYRLFWC